MTRKITTNLCKKSETNTTEGNGVGLFYSYQGPYGAFFK